MFPIRSWALLAIFLCALIGISASPIDEVVPQLIAAPDYRLPLTIKPTVYNLTLRPYLLANEGDRRFTFDGEVFINITATIATNTLVLHSRNLYYKVMEYWIATDGNATKIQLPTPSIDSITDKLTFKLDRCLIASTIYTLHFIYIGSMDDDMFGFYRSSYTDENNVTKWLGSTQFQTEHARRAFPSFDEPKFKAEFDVTLIRHKSMKSFSNTRILNSKANGEYYTDVFIRTPKMSTYLLAFFVSEFNERYNGAFGVIARPELYAQTNYSFTIGQKILKEFDNYLQLPYYELGNDKMHMAAIPDFAPGAMENWGLLTFRESNLLYHEGSTNLKAKQSITHIIGHEQTHMWFGNLVTCDWWSYTWLNEGFARYFQYHMTAKVEPDWALEQQFVFDHVQTAMGMDATNSTYPITNENIKSPNDLNPSFKKISYGKAASVIRMVKFAMGKENFRKSLQEYLSLHKYQNTVPQNLLDVWEKYGPNYWRKYGSEVFKSFTEQVGYPVVNITVFEQNGSHSIEITQNRFLLNDLDGSDANLRYTIPFTYTTNLEKNFGATSPRFYLKAPHASTYKSLPVKVDWLIANIQESGYYRVNYDTKNWHSIHSALLSNKFDGIHELNRAQIVDDLFQLARANYIDYDFAMPILEYLDTENHYMPWMSAFNGYNYLTIRLGTETKNFAIHILKQLEKVYKQLGYDERSTDVALDIYNRANVLKWACKYGNEDCISQARSRFQNMHSKPVPVNIRTAVYCTVMREGGESEFNTLFNKYQAEPVATERSVILSAFGCVKAQGLIERYFNIIISDVVRRQDKSAALTSLYTENNENVTPVFDLVTKEYKKLAGSMGSYSAVAGVISNIAARFTEKSQQDKLIKFNVDHKADFGSSAATLERAESTVAENLYWAFERLGTFKQYLEKRANSSDVASLTSQTGQKFENYIHLI